MMLIPVRDFNLEATLDCGQVFGFVKKDGEYHGEIRGAAVALSASAGRLHVRAETVISADTVRDYFDLKRDLGPFYAILRTDEKLLPAYQACCGLRLIRQDPWEGLACFILSSNNNVKRIQRIWKNLCRYYDRRRKSGVKSFPSAPEIAASHESLLRELGLGYRAPFLWATARYVAGNPDCLRYIKEDAYVPARERVMAFPGIGPKVADCVLLYAFQKYEAFPVDVWILRAMRKLYFKNRKVSENRVREFAQKRWGKDAGYVQQYIFHGIRMGILS